MLNSTAKESVNAMTGTIGKPDNPLQVAIIGAGPSGFYAADALLKQTTYSVEIDMFDRLPTPFGLVRGGVAPDHQKIKSVTKVYEKIAAHPSFRLYGNVEFGRAITHDEFRQHYHQIVYAVGAQTDRKLGIPGENLEGSYAATQFVAWYNSHPDFRYLNFDLSKQIVAVVGNGNVAMDVARILASTYDELHRTDIADYALEALSHSKITDIYLLGRRGPAQAAFTNPELKELGEMEDADVIVLPDEVALDPISQADIAAHPDPMVAKNMATLAEFATRQPQGKPRRIHLRFLVSPLEIGGAEHVENIKLVKNMLQLGSDGSIKAKATDQIETLPIDLVFRSIGYVGVALPGVPFNAAGGVIPNHDGRVYDPATDQTVPGEYAVGWIKRGANGIIGTNKPNSQATVNSMLADVPNLAALDANEANRASVEALLTARQPDFTTFDDWLVLDQHEIARGQEVNRPRVKFSDVDQMLKVLKEARAQNSQPTATPPVVPVVTAPSVAQATD